MLLRITLTLAWVVALASLAGAAPLRDGQRFDPGATLTSPAENAPASLADLVPLLGDWSVTFTRHHADGTHHRTEGAARITFMNKGHAFMERFHAVNSDTSGIEINTLTFFTYPPAQERWVVGVGSGYTENLTT